MISMRLRRTVTLLAIAWYLPFVLTLDLHHNHGFPQPLPKTASVSQPSSILQAAEDTEICPVLRVSLAHGLFLVPSYMVVSTASYLEVPQPCFCWDDVTRHSSARAPPVLS